MKYGWATEHTEDTEAEGYEEGNLTPSFSVASVCSVAIALRQRAWGNLGLTPFTDVVIYTRNQIRED